MAGRFGLNRGLKGGVFHLYGKEGKKWKKWKKWKRKSEKKIANPKSLLQSC